MADYTVTTRHIEAKAFDNQVQRHTVRMDASEAHGGTDTGPSPKRLLLGTLATCSGIDVVGMLRKMRVDFSDLEITTEAELTDGTPSIFARVLLTYRIAVDEADQAKVEKAVRLSQETYCGITAMLRPAVPIEWTVEFR